MKKLIVLITVIIGVVMFIACNPCYDSSREIAPFAGVSLKDTCVNWENPPCWKHMFLTNVLHDSITMEIIGAQNRIRGDYYLDFRMYHKGRQIGFAIVSFHKRNAREIKGYGSFILNESLIKKESDSLPW